MRISLVPDGVYESYRQITPELLQSKGIRLLLSDLDFTLAPKSTPRPRQKAAAGGLPPGHGSGRDRSRPHGHAGG